MFHKIYIEKHLADRPRTLQMLARLEKISKHAEIIYIDHYETSFNHIKKPYLKKREELNLYVAEKKGQLVKVAPDAYGLSGEAHYYFVHAYNCIYECDYCYLQGYFHRPDIVIFINQEEILAAMDEIIKEHANHPLTQDKKVWFHAGEFSDSLALTHITGELEELFQFFSKRPNALLELRTKSINTKELIKLPPLPNIFISFSLSPEEQVKEHDLKTPKLNHRLKAIRALDELGFQIGIHFDPIIYTHRVIEDYEQLILSLNETISLSRIHYLSLGVVRFTDKVFSAMKKNYPTSKILDGSMVKSFDQKVRYPKPVRLWMMNKIKSLLVDHGLSKEKIYLCMEDEIE